ncbi:MAG: hypothetical protein AAFU61_17405, partial [Pseudomonadota bacterium]
MDRYRAASSASEAAGGHGGIGGGGGQDNAREGSRRTRTVAPFVLQASGFQATIGGDRGGVPSPGAGGSLVLTVQVGDEVWSSGGSVPLAAHLQAARLQASAAAGARTKGKLVAWDGAVELPLIHPAAAIQIQVGSKDGRHVIGEATTCLSGVGVGEALEVVLDLREPLAPGSRLATSSSFAAAGGFGAAEAPSGASGCLLVTLQYRATTQVRIQVVPAAAADGHPGL